MIDDTYEIHQISVMCVGRWGRVLINKFPKRGTQDATSQLVQRFAPAVEIVLKPTSTTIRTAQPISLGVPRAVSSYFLSIYRSIGLE